ncbi:hypothetical protein ACFYTQ_19380 [Nocardia sp. NPDC004068]|uniref:hypothetical protein n=1 Tax=Nocardia sp. NPDC004068 TaxID=3364303 RepID=UPI0036BD9638
MANGDGSPINPTAATAGAITQTGTDAGQSHDRATKSQQGAESVQRGLRHTSTDPDYIVDLEHWERMSHEEIFNTVQRSMQPDAMHAAAQKWLEISAAVGGALFGLNISIQKTLSEKLKGTLADTASDAARTFVQQGTEVQEVMQAVGARIHAAGYGAEAVKNNVPPPVPEKPTSTTNFAAALLGLGAEVPEQAVGGVRSAGEARQLAIAAMKLNYDPTYRPAGQKVPTFVPVDSPGEVNPGTGGGNSWPGTGGGTGGTNGGTGGTSGGTGETGGGTGEQSGNGTQDPNSTDGGQRTDPASVSPASTDGSNSSGTQGTSGTGGGTSSEADTRPAGVDSPGSSVSGRGGGGSGLRPGTSGGGQGGTGGGSTANAPGRSVPGMPGAGNPAAAAAGRAGAAGTSGMPGMGMPGAHGRKDDDEAEHKTPDYLIRDREEELFGPRQRTVPQAIGADIPAAQTRPDEGEGSGR